MLAIGSKTQNILPINKNPLIYGYSHYAISTAIIDNPMLYKEKDAVYQELFSTDTLIDRGVEFYGGEYNQSIENEQIIVNMNSFSNTNDKIYYSYYKVSNNCELTVKIEYINQANIASEIGIMICNELPASQCFYNPSLIKLFFSPAEKIRSCIYLDDDYKRMDNHANAKLPVWLKLAKDNDVVILSLSYNNEEWTEIARDKYNWNDEFYIGVYLEPKAFTYYNWLNSNFIQIHCDQYLGEKGGISDVELDLYNGFKTRGNYLLSNPFVFTECIERHEVLKLMDINEFIISSIDNQKYVQLMLNERFVPNRFAFNKCNFAHLNLIYGYDLQEKKYYLMGHDIDGHFTIGEINFLQFMDAVNTGIPGNDKVSEDYITRISRSNSEFPYEINLDIIIEFLHDYLNGINSYKKCGFMNAPPTDRIFGISVYKCITDYYNPQSTSVRILHSLLEHKILMINRIEFLFNNKIITIEEYQILISYFKKIYDKVKIARSIQIKYNISSNNPIQVKQKIIDLLSSVKKEEEIAFQMLIDVLSSKR